MSSTVLSVDDDLLLRLAGPGPRYTSYPTVPEWSGDFGEAEARAAYGRAAARPDLPLSIYVHIPFCARLCLYCGCIVDVTRRADRVEAYLDALEREIAIIAGLLGERRRLSQLHLGGGTPTHLDPRQLRRLHRVITDHFELLPDAEQSLEVHPHVTSFEQVDALVELGFDRFSMGVQDLDPHIQKIINRDQTTEETAALIHHCRERGVEGINLDLLYGLPDQTEETFGRTLETIVSLRPDRLAVYGYAHVPWLKRAQRKLEEYDLPDSRLRARLFGQAIETLGEAGYEVIGLDHFALRTDSLYQGLVDGSLHRNFMGYTTIRAPDMVSFGMSSIGDVGGAFVQNDRDTRRYQEALAEGRLPVLRGLERSPEDELRRMVIQTLMCRMGLDLDELEERTGRTDLARHFEGEWRALEGLRASGLCRLEPRRVEILPTGRLFLRHFAMVFDEYLETGREQRFSQTL